MDSTVNESPPNKWAKAVYPGDPLAHLRWWCDTSERAAGELGGVLNERDRLRAELEAIRRLVLPHPDATAGQDDGCGCDMVSTVDAVSSLSRMMDAMTAQFLEQKRLNVALADRLEICREILARAAETGRVCVCNTPMVGAGN